MADWPDRPLTARLPALGLTRSYTRPMSVSAPEAGFLTLGQRTARTVALRAARRERLGRTFLVHGPAGAGKGAFVDDLLALLLCTDADRSNRPCNACPGCRSARSRSHPDLVIGSPEIWRDTRSTGESLVAAARRWLGSTAGAPIAGERRVILIEGADRAGEQIQNAFLKVLEEPSDRHVFILVADEPDRLLDTVRSRCQPLRIGPVSRQELSAWLMDRELLPRDQADALTRLSDGYVGRARALASGKGERLEWRRRVQRELLDLLQRGRAERFVSARELLDDASRRAIPPESPEPALADAASDPSESTMVTRSPAAVQRAAASALVEAWISLARDLMVTGAGRSEVAPGTELFDDLAAASQAIDPGELIRFIGLLETIHEGLAENTSPRLALEVAMLAWPCAPES
jgi:DNA polymerase III subunit delta'